MWIRSQDLYTLIKCDCLSVRQCGSKNYCIIGNERIVLGEYSTLDKALRVLDEIQKYIGSERFYSTTKGIGEQQSISIENTNVFQMPQDEDVEIKKGVN